MSASDLPAMASPPRRRDAERWRRRSRVIRILRIALPACIGLIFASLVGAVTYNAVSAGPAKPAATDEPIRLVNPRFMGRDEKGRGFVLTAGSAVRDQKDYQRVVLDRPALVLDEAGPDELRVGSRNGIYHEGDRKLELKGGVRISGAKAAFETAASMFDTKTGELVGSGPIQGSGSLGNITAKSYGVYGKGDRMVFKGGVRSRLETK
jgi:lipopolysaccharide export system protein LptC